MKVKIIIRKAKREIRKALAKENLPFSCQFSKQIKCVKTVRFYLSRLAEKKRTVFWIMLYENLTAFVGLMVSRGKQVLDSEDV